MSQPSKSTVLIAKLGEETLSRELQGLQIGRRRSKSLSYATAPSNIESSLFSPSCSCNTPSRLPPLKKDVVFKRPNRKVLKEPVLKFLGQNYSHFLRSGEKSRIDKLMPAEKPAELQLCQQMTLAHLEDGIRESQPRARSVDRSSPTTTTTCSTQARNTTVPPCDVTIDELASYFETFVHIPKKMSSMAEMMYI